ncbi:MAG TPA: leucyl aminopeptidase [Nitrospinaceae bacterium]|nr:leucyl aminopeptidase [Nitrospinaceae bacterium]
MIKTTIKNERLQTHKTECLILFCPEEKKPSGKLAELDAKLKGLIGTSFKNKRFKGKHNQTFLLNVPKPIQADYLLLVGLGKVGEITGDKLRQAAGTAARCAENEKLSTISFYIPTDNSAREIHDGLAKSDDSFSQTVAEGSLLSLYHFEEYKEPEKDKPRRVKQITLLTAEKSQVSSMRSAVARGRKLAEAVYVSRDLISHPSSTATPSYLADKARDTAKTLGMTCKILKPGDMSRLGMGALLGVAKGSHEPPAFIALEHHGGAKNDPPVVIVGKGITFDTGGISLKPPASMDEMKMDMSGGSVAMATLFAAAALKIPTNVVGLIPASENMPSGTAIKPGDILKSMSGKTIEVLNTDAEGRLILADALTYAARYKPKAVIDLATLTGAVIVALGHQAAAILGNNDELANQLQQCGEVTGERLWPLPLWPEHEKAVKSSIADLKNIASPGVGAGTITAAAFLKAFAGEQPWCHLDIAGTSWSGEDKPYTPKGASGFGVRLLIRFLEQEAASNPS